MPGYLPFVLIVPPYFPDRPHHPRACQELNIHEEVEAGCFLTGHPEIKEPVGGAMLGFAAERVFLFGTGGSPLGSVSYRSIVTVSVETHQAVLKRFSEARLMLLGNRLLAFRSRETSDGSYVVVEWESGKGGAAERHDGIFCFEGLAADHRARRVRDAILHYAARHHRATGVPAHPEFSHLLDEFEVRHCEHCGKTHRPGAPASRDSKAKAA
jgi:hypothetical protein